MFSILRELATENDTLHLGAKYLGQCGLIDDPSPQSCRTELYCVLRPKFWGGGLGLASHLAGSKLDAAYEYINWYTSGWVGGYLNRQGYYSAAMDTAKEFMTADEWGYWIEGKSAIGDIMSPEGKVMEKAGAVRDGGSFYERMGRVACWNSVMDEDRYMVRRWNEFIAA